MTNHSFHLIRHKLSNMRILFSALCCLLFTIAHSQKVDSLAASANNVKATLGVMQRSNTNDSIIVRKDGRLDMLNAIQAKLNKKAARMTYNGLYHGYRLQVLSTQSREQAFDLKASLLQRFPEQKAYTIFQSPYFKVRFGNFIDRDEANRYKKMLSSIYTQAIYIVDDNVEYTPPKDEDITSE